MWETFSEAVLGSLKMLHSQVVTPEIMDALGDTLQRLQSKTSYDAKFADNAQRAAKPGPHKLPSLGEAGERRPGSTYFTASAGSANLRTGRLRIASQVSFLGFARYTQLRSIRLDSYSNRERVA
jgi:hypothetical protein